jgi:hypothetical protein
MSKELLPTFSSCLAAKSLTEVAVCVMRRVAAPQNAKSGEGF